MTDTVMARIIQGVTDFRAGEHARARTALLDIWTELGPAGDPLHRCTLAHYLADAYDDPAEALVWDIRALDAADALTDSRLGDYHAGPQAAGFYPPLPRNLAANLRRPGSFPAATLHLDTARARLDPLPDNDYGALIRRVVPEIELAIAANDTTRRPTP